MCAYYREYGDCTDDVAVVLKTSPFQFKGFFYYEEENSCLDAHFKSRVSSFNLIRTQAHTYAHIRMHAQKDAHSVTVVSLILAYPPSSRTPAQIEKEIIKRK